MLIPDLHSWDLTPTQAIQLQKQLVTRVRLESLRQEPELITACDVSFDKTGTELFAALATFRRHDLSVVEEVTFQDEMRFPYVPGLLSFRELPVVLQAFARLEHTPDLVLCDGQGIAHPRRMGIATHLGLWLNLPPVGCAKKLLCRHHKDVEDVRGAFTPIVYQHDTIGYALRTRPRVKPIFVSPGHLCSHDDAIRIVLSLITKYRHPEPIRYVHKLSNQIRITVHSARGIKSSEDLPIHS